MKMTPDYQIAMAAGRDAGNRSMRKAGRAAWNRRDHEAAITATAMLMEQYGDVCESDAAHASLVALAKSHGKHHPF